jgi:hypothetical protein
MSVLREQFANDATTSLASSANTTTTSISLTDASAFPSVGNFRVKADSEIMLATARSSNTLTVVRAQEGTTAASHSGGATVSQILTAGALQQWGSDNIPGWNGTAPPRCVYDTSGNRITSSAFTQTNFSGCTALDDGQSIGIYNPAGGASGENLRLLTLSAPATPYSVVAQLDTLAFGSTQNFGLCFRNSSSGKVSALSLINFSNGQGEFHVYQWTNPTTFSSNASAHNNAFLKSAYVWFKIKDDGTNTIYYASPDGINFVQLYSESRTSFFSTGPNEVGVYSNNYDELTDAILKVNSFTFA